MGIVKAMLQNLKRTEFFEENIPRTMGRIKEGKSYQV